MNFGLFLSGRLVGQWTANLLDAGRVVREAPGQTPVFIRWLDTFKFDSRS